MESHLTITHKHLAVHINVTRAAISTGVAVTELVLQIVVKRFIVTTDKRPSRVLTHLVRLTNINVVLALVNVDVTLGAGETERAVAQIMSVMSIKVARNSVLTRITHTLVCFLAYITFPGYSAVTYRPMRPACFRRIQKHHCLRVRRFRGYIHFNV